MSPRDQAQHAQPDSDADATLRGALTVARLRKRAGIVTFERGEDYASAGRVVSIDVTVNGLSGIVEESALYRVSIDLREGEVEGACDCPMGGDGHFCKHQVALALAWLGQVQGVSRSGQVRPVSMDEVREHLLDLEPARLVDLLLAQAERDDALRRRLLSMAAVAAGDGHVSVRRAVDEAVRTTDYIRYAEAWDFVEGIMEAVQLIDEVRRDGDPVAAIELAEHALRRVESAISDVDDSDGGMGKVLGRLQDIHLAACQDARPDPVALAMTLFEWELHDEWDVFADAVARYRDVLGDEGMLRYRMAAEEVWSQVPPVGPGGRGIGIDPDFPIKRIMETLARMRGDVDALIAVVAHDLASPYEYLRIAEVCAEAGRADEALDWAERGIADFHGRADERLRRFLMTEYERLGRHEDAVAQAWAAFTETSSLVNYQVLRELVIRRSGTTDGAGGNSTADDPTRWRERSVAHIRQAVIDARVGRPAAGGRVRFWGPTGAAAVQILVDDGEIEEAWTVASELGCGRFEWLDLATRREREHPDDSITVYQREVEVLIDVRTNDAYADAVDLMTRIRAIREREGRLVEWRGYLSDVRARHGRKRNLVKLLDRQD